MDASVSKKYSSQCVLDVGARLAEGPHWWSDRGLLLWVDIEDSRIGFFDPIQSGNHFLDVGSHVGCVVPMKNGDLLAATSDGFKQINLETGDVDSLHNPEQNLYNNRFNDGKCDPWGRLWAGSVNYHFLPKAASLWRLDTCMRSDLMLSNVTVSNGIAWSLNRKYLYYIDSPTLQVRRFLLSNSGDLIGDGDVCIRIPASWGCVPDGMTIDREGMLWIALWNGGSVTRWDPKTGKLLAKVEVPCSKVTSCCFGGSGFEKLFITTANYDLDPDELRLSPQAGGIFMAEVDTPGWAASEFGDFESC